MRDFTKTRAAVAAYDTHHAEFCAWCEHLSGKDALAMLAESDALKLAVGVAFCEETSDINHMDIARLVGPDAWLRRTIGLTS